MAPPRWRRRGRTATSRTWRRPGASARSPGCARRSIGPPPRRRAYVRLATVAPALGAPESAVVAAFERIDLSVSDAMAEIVANAVEPDRALSDHAFAHRLARRAGTTIMVGSRSARRRAGPVIGRPVGSRDPGRSGARPAAPRGHRWRAATG